MPSTEGSRALVVDDSATARLFLAHSLEEFGFSVLKAEGGAEALELLSQQSRGVDIAFVDWHMPGMDGLSFVRTLRDEKGSDCPVMMVTSESTLDKIELALEAGAQEFLMKPFEPAMLRDKLALLGFEVPE